MARMIRKQIVIDAEREKTLERLAKERGMSQSELIRLAIDELDRAEDLFRTQEERRKAAHERLMALFEQGVSLGLTDEDGNRTWKRDDLHGERGFPRH